MSLDDTQVFLPEVWASHARFRADKPAIVCGGVRLTWGELNERCNTIANALLERELGKPARVAVLMSNSADMVAVFLGVMKSGACIVPISTALTAAQIATLLNDSGAACLIADSANVSLAESALGHLAAPFQGPQVVVDGAVSGWESLADWTREASTDEPAVRYSLEDDFNIIYSSVTTGRPKGIVQTHRARQHWSYSNALELRMDSRTVALATTPLYSNGTWFMLLPPLFVGATIVIMDSFTPGHWLQCVEDEGVTHSFMVPTQYIGVLEALDASSHDLSSLNYLLSAGSPLRQDTKHAVIARL